MLLIDRCGIYGMHCVEWLCRGWGRELFGDMCFHTPLVCHFSKSNIFTFLMCSTQKLEPRLVSASVSHSLIILQMLNMALFDDVMSPEVHFFLQFTVCFYLHSTFDCLSMIKNRHGLRRREKYRMKTTNVPKKHLKWKKYNWRQYNHKQHF